jgi:hypothetical protein
MSRSEKLKSCKLFEQFLTINDTKEWEKIVKLADKVKHSRVISDLPTETGLADVQIH